MNEFTVILLYPDYVAENYGQDTWMGVVKGRTTEEAIQRARAAAACKHENIPPDDLFVIAVLFGAHDDIKPTES